MSRCISGSEALVFDGFLAATLRKMAMTVWGSGARRLQIVRRSDAAGFEVSLTVAWLATSNATERPLLRSSASP